MTVNGKYNPNLNLYRFINESVEKKKLYKSGKSWLIASATLFVFATMGATGVHADTTPTVSATVPEQVVQKAGQNNNASVSNVSVETPVDNNSSNKSEVQNQKYDLPSNDVSKTNNADISVNQTNSEAVKNTNSDNLKDNNDTNEVPEKVEKNTDNSIQENKEVTTSNLDQKTETQDSDDTVNKNIQTQKQKQFTNFSVINQSNPDGNLQKAIDDARSKGIVVNVNNKTVTVLSNDLSDEEKQLQAHYADEIDYIMQTEKDYAAALQKATDDYNNALKDYQDAINKLPNPGGLDPNTIHNNISLPNQGEYNGNNVDIVSLNNNWQSWTGYKDANSDNGWQGGKANTPAWVVSLPGGWVQNGNKVTVIAPKDRNNVDVNNVGTIRIKLSTPGYYHDPVTGQNTVIGYLQTRINNVGNRDANHYRDTTGGHYQNLLYSGDLGLTGSWAIDSINTTDQFLDENGNAINFEHGGGYLNDLNQRMNEKDTNGAVINWADPNNPDTNHWWRGPKEWNNWTKDGGSVFFGTASQWGNGAQGHSYIGSSVYQHDDGYYYSDQSNMRIWNAGAPMNGAIVSTDPNNPAYNETANHDNSDQFESSGAMLNGLSWDHTEKLLDNAQNSFGNLSYLYNATIPPAQDIPAKPVKQEVPTPKIDIDKTTINSVTPTPDKSVHDSTGQDINDKNVIGGSSLDYKISWDLTGLNDLNPNSEKVAKGLSITDNYDSKTTAEQDTLRVYDQSGKDVTDQVNVSWDSNNHVVNVAAKDANSFFNSFKNQKLNVKFTADVNDGASGDISNSATQNTFGNSEKTNVVIDHVVIPNPTKTVTDSTGQDINGKNVIAGSSLDYGIDWDLNGLKDFNPTKNQVAKGLSITDNYDSKTTAEQSTLKVYDQNGRDVTDQVYVTWNAENHLVTIVAKDANNFFNSFKDQKLKIKFIADVNDGATGDVSNIATQNTFGNSNKTNSVIDHIIVPNPTKTVKNQNGQQIDGKNVSRGDTLDYNINWDLTGLNDFNPTSGQIAKGLSITDNYSKYVLPDKSLIRLIDNGKDITDEVNVSWNDADNSFTMSAKNILDFWNKYRGSNLTIDFPTTVMGNSGSDILNQATQNTFGNSNKTNIVVSHEPQINPKKDIVIDAGSNDSMDKQTVAIGQTFDYKLGASRPGNYGGNTNEWSFIDTVPVQDHITGQWQVFASSEITLSDGTVVNKGTDISKYFTFTIDRNTGKVVISANKEFLDIINSDINKKNEIDWDAYFQVKRIGYGNDITNIAEESYNHQIVKTNKVTTNTPEPVKPVETPKPKDVPTVAQVVKEVVEQKVQCNPSIKQVVQEVVKKSNNEQPKKNVLPQTGVKKDEAKNVGFLILGLTGIMSLFGLAKSRKNKKL